MGKQKWKGRTGLGLTASVILALGIGVAMAALIFSQTFPATGTGANTVLTTNCSSTPLTATVSDNETNASGAVLYTCGAPGSDPAFTATSSQPATPWFALPALNGTPVFGYVTDNATPSCSGPIAALTSGTPLAFTPGTYDYCLTYSQYPSAGIPTFGIQWTQ
jgi:hypothetical protein